MVNPKRRLVDPEVDWSEVLGDRLGSLTPDEIAWLRVDVMPTLSHFSATALERLLASRSAIGWRADPHTMAMYLDPAVEDYRTARFLAGKFRGAVTGEGSRLQVWNLPAQIGKSSNLRRGCVWALDRDPAAPLIYLSYGDTLARESAIAIRDTALAHPTELRFQLRPDLRRQNRWQTTEGGGLLATGITGGVSGFPAHGVIIDDPLKNWQEAHSPQRRKEVWNEIIAVARLRLREGGFMILAHTRWHLEDPSGMFMRLGDELGIEVEFVVLPMIAEADDIMGRAPGEPLEPARFSLKECQARALILGSYLTSSMEQQHPVPEQGGEIKRAWWQWETRMPEAFEADAWLSSWDCKLKDKQSGDYVVGQVWARVGPGFWCTDQMRGQYTLQQTKVAIAVTIHRHPHVTTHVVENAGNGPEVMEQLGASDPLFVLTDEMCTAVGVAMHERDAVEAIVQRGVAGLVPQNVTENKLVRARTVAPFIESGHVHLPQGASWANALVDEAAAFPPSQGGHDDQVDAMSQALSRLRLMDARVAVPTGTVTPPAPSARAVGSVRTMIPNRNRRD